MNRFLRLMLLAFSFLGAGAIAQSPPPPSPAAQQTAAQTQSGSAPNGNSPTQTESVPMTKVQLDNWLCTLHAATFNIWRLEVVVTTLSTYHLQRCPPSRMDKLSVASAAAQLRTVASFDTILKGGSHQQIMDINLTPVSSEYYWVSDLRFSVQGTVRISLSQLYATTKLKNTKNLAGASYVPFKLQGESHYIWNTGSLAHRLVSPKGETYIMTAYTKEVQPTLSRDNLSNLNTMLRLPPGWTYENYFLDKTIVVRSGVDNDNAITVLFDDLNNNYVLYD